MSDTSLNSIIQYGTAAARAAFTPDPASGSQVLYVWFETDNSPDTYVWNGSAWIQINNFIASLTSSVGLTIDGGGAEITTGIKGYIRVPYTGTITKVTMLADISGSIVVDIWKDTYANYPPVDADSITAAAIPTISAAIKSEDSTLTGWTTSITAGDVLGFNVDSVTDITRLTLTLDVLRS